MKKLFFLLVLVAQTAHTKPIVFFESDPTLLTTTVTVLFHGGSANEEKDKVGAINLLSDLVLRGTQKMNRSQFQNAMERLGGSLSGNASAEQIQFSGGVIKENTMPFLDLLASSLTEPALLEAEFKLLKKERLAQIAHIKNNNNRLGGLALRKIAFENTPLAVPVSGSLKTVQKIELNDLKAQLKKQFNKNNVVFAIASPLPEPELAQKINEIWEKLPDGEKINVPLFTPKIPEKPTIVVVNKPKTSTGSVYLGQAGITINDPKRYDLALGNFAFGSEPLVSRLFRVVRSEMGWTYSIGSTYTGLGMTKQQGLYLLFATPSVEYTVKTMFKTMSLWKDYLKDGVRGSELTVAQASSINSYPFEFETAQDRLSKKLANYLYDIPIHTPSEYEKLISDISNETIQKALVEKHKENSWLITVVADLGVFKAQLEKEQKDLPADQKIAVSQVLTPDQVIQ